MKRMAPFARRFFLSAGALAVLPASLFAQPLTVNFDTQFLGTFPTPGVGEFGVWSNGQTIAADDIWVSFQASAAGNFSATILGETLSYNAAGQQWTYGTETYTSIMSPSFTVSDLNLNGGFTASNVQGHNMFIEYGTNSIGQSTPPEVGAPIRYTTVEWTYVEGGSNNNADLTYINNIGASLNLQYVGPNTTASLGMTQDTKQTIPFVASQSPTSVIVSASTSTGAPSLGGGGNYVAAVQGASSFTAGTGFFTEYPTVIANAITANLASPLLTNINGGTNPTPADRVGGAGFIGTVADIAPGPPIFSMTASLLPAARVPREPPTRPLPEGEARPTRQITGRLCNGPWVICSSS
jgi:hypothetical protein